MRAAVITAMVMCGLATGARADVVSYATNFVVTARDLAFGTDPLQSLTPFNTSLGTLTSASVELQGAFSLTSYFLLPEGGEALPTTASITPHLDAFPLSLGTIPFPTQANLPVVNGSIIGLQSFSFDVTGSLPMSYASAADPILNLQPYTTISNANGSYDTADEGD